MKKFKRVGLSAVLALSLALTSACGQTNTDGQDEPEGVPAQTTPNVTVPQPKNPDEKKANDKDDEVIEVSSLVYATESIALNPGETFTPVLDLKLKQENTDLKATEAILQALNYESSHPEIVSVLADGTLIIANDAPIGSEATITTSYSNLTATLQVYVKLSLEQTLLDVVAANGMPVVSNERDLTVVVNKQRSLPDDFKPDQLVVPDVPFSFSGEDEKKQMQKPAAEALEQLFKKAKQDNINLYAVSGYRSFQRQTAVFNNHVNNLGEEEARRYSAVPGTSEHQTGLAMDVSSPSVNYRLVDSFGDTEEGRWLAENCAEFGFIIRYPNGKEHITGYAYEPWHLRYVGPTLAKVIMELNTTLEEYFSESIPVIQGQS